MKTASQLEKYAELSRHSNWAPQFKKIDNLHDAIIKMESIHKDVMDIGDELLDAIEQDRIAFEAFKNARRKALSVSSQFMKIHWDGGLMNTRINELVSCERECFDAEDIDESLISLARQKASEYRVSTKNLAQASFDFRKNNNTKIIKL